MSSGARYAVHEAARLMLDAGFLADSRRVATTGSPVRDLVALAGFFLVAANGCEKVGGLDALIPSVQREADLWQGTTGRMGSAVRSFDRVAAVLGFDVNGLYKRFLELMTPERQSEPSLTPDMFKDAVDILVEESVAVTAVQMAIEGTVKGLDLSWDADQTPAVFAKMCGAIEASLSELESMNEGSFGKTLRYELARFAETTLAAYMTRTGMVDPGVGYDERGWHSWAANHVADWLGSEWVGRASECRYGLLDACDLAATILADEQESWVESAAVRLFEISRATGVGLLKELEGATS